ncbi:hypothetical protein ACJX0J_029013, partial [Zea mays]
HSTTLAVLTYILFGFDILLLAVLTKRKHATYQYDMKYYLCLWHTGFGVRVKGLGLRIAY